jgi:TetR/AcrR family tetracycline transcriptional repressor
LTRDELVRAALQVLDAVGLDGLTMRQLAQQLGVQSASLYWHVRDKDELLALIADSICADIEPARQDQPWIEQLEAAAWEFRRVLLAHRNAALVLANTLPVGPNRLRQAEQMLSLLVRAGFAPAEAAKAGLLMTDFVTNAVIEEERQHAMRAALRAEPDAQGGGAIRQWFASLPLEQYPTLVALADELTDDDAHARFHFGVQTLLAGLLVQLGGRRSGRKRGRL